ncbi:MAG: hypothetical protein U9N46_12145 [Euryarchaeota archaeon]|nr:hypothetical protein [Euryarchaeota archaeon]
MVNKKILLGVTVIAMLTLSVGVAWADEVTSDLNYQGLLADSAGNPMSGAYSTTFLLYDVSSGGTALDTDIHDVVATDGLFNTEIDFDQSYFDGRALWLGIKVGTDSEMIPRQEFRPAPYALSLVPGARIIGDRTWPATLSIENYGSHPALRVENRFPWSRAVAVKTNSWGSCGVDVNTTGNGSAGVRVDADGDDSAGVWVDTDGEGSEGFHAYTTGEDSEGFHAYTTGEDSEGFHAYTTGEDSEGFYAETFGDYSEGVNAKTRGYDSPAVYGFSSRDVGVYGKGKEGGYFTTTTAGTLQNRLAGVNVSTTYDFNPGVYAMITGDNSYGAYAYTTGEDSEGFYAYTTGEDSEGFYAETFGDYSEGVNARTAGKGSEGVYAKTTGEDSPAVYGWSEQSVGVRGNGNTYDFYADGAGTNYGPFTGAHEVKLSADFPENVTPGMIVSVTGGTQVRQIDGRNISFSSTLPTVQLSDTPDDSKVLGVLISESPLPEEHWYIDELNERDRFGIVNALGDGRVWVTDINGGIEAGDYITTSLVAGYGQKQNDDLLHSYTLGKAIESVNWSKLTTTVGFNGQICNAYPIAVVYTSG